MYASTLGVEEEYHMQTLEVTLTQIGSTKKSFLVEVLLEQSLET